MDFLLAWRLFVLGCPLLASIWDVLTNSVDLMKKLIICWILLQLLSLFEYVSLNFIGWNITEWIPYWSCVRLGVVIFLCFVMPHFRGAYLSYEGSVRFFLLNVIERYIQECGSRFLGRRTALQKQRQNEECIDFQSDNKVIERERENTAVTSNQKQRQNEKCIDFQSDNKVIERERENTAVTSNQVNGVEMTKNGCTAIVTPPSVPTQKEWRCDICLMTFWSLSRLYDHQGIAHKSKVGSLKTSARDTGLLPTPSLTPAARVPNVEEMMPPKENRFSETPPLNQQKLICAVCGDYAPNQSLMNVHILATKHTSNLESSKESSLDARDTTPSPSVQQKHSVSAASSSKGICKALEFEDLMPAEESKEKRFANTFPLKTERRRDNNLIADFHGIKHQSKLRKQSKIGSKDRGPSPSATSEMNHGIEAEKLTKESGSESEKLRGSKIGHEACSSSRGDSRVVNSQKGQGQHGTSVRSEWVRKGGDANTEDVKDKRRGDRHGHKKMLNDDDLQKPKLERRKTDEQASS